MLEVPTKNPQYLPCEAEVRRPGPNHRETDPLEGLCEVQHQGHCSQIFFPARYLNLSISIRISQTSLSSSISVISGVQSTRYFLCHFATSNALRASLQRINVGISAIGLSLVALFGIQKNIVVQACCGHLPLCSTFSKNSTISSVVSLVKSRGTFW